MSPEHGQRWAPGAFIFVLVMCLVYTAGTAKTATTRADDLNAKLATSEALVLQMTESAALEHEAHRVEVAYLQGLLVDRNAEIEDLEAGRPKTHIREDRETPVFAHEWTYPRDGR